MIEIKGLCKLFDAQPVLDRLDAQVETGSIYGLIGTNGAGKSTLLNILAGIYQKDAGSVQIDGCEIYETPETKDRIAFVSDSPYFLPSTTLDEMAKFHDVCFTDFSMEKYQHLKTFFPLDSKRKINTYSKGMKRQAAILLALSRRPKVLLCDESFDGLDQAVRQMVKRLLVNETAKENLTIVISSHNLRELEDLCDTIAILHQNRIIVEKSMDEIRTRLHKIQVGIKPMPDEEAFSFLNPLSVKIRGNTAELIVRGELSEIESALQNLHPLLVDALDLTLEEIFIHEMEVSGYDFSKILL